MIVDARGDRPPPASLDRAAAVLRAGGVVAVPTDTVYGLAAGVRHPAAVERLFALKERPASTALPVLVGSREQVAQLAGALDPVAEALAERFWPGPLTLVVRRHPAFTVDLGGSPAARRTVGVRWPAHPVVVELCRRLGPLAVTSANRHGRAPATTAEEVAGAFGGRAVDGEDPPGLLVLDAGRCDGQPSTVVECLGGAPRGRREGPLSFAALGAVAAGEDTPIPPRLPAGREGRG